MLRPEIVLSVILFMLSGCKGCVAQQDPTSDWELFEEESEQANQELPTLTDGGKLPPKAAEGEQVADVDPVELKYSQFCASCHGAEGKGDGPAGSALKPPPRNFVTWNDDVSDEHIAKVIREGGVAVGLSAAMAPWGSVLSEEEVQGMVEKIRAFRK